MIVPYLDGEYKKHGASTEESEAVAARPVAGEVAAVFAKDGSGSESTVTVSDLRFDWMLSTCRLRSSLTLNLLAEFASAHPQLAMPNPTKDLIDNDLLMSLSAEEISFVLPSKRAMFWSAFWTHARTSTCKSDLTAAVDAAADLAAGKPLRSAVPQAATKDDINSGHAEAPASSHDLVDCNDNETFEKLMRTCSASPSGLRSQDCWDAAYLFVSLQRYFFIEQIHIWDWSGVVIEHHQATSQLVCQEELATGMTMPFFGKIAVSNLAGKDVKGAKLLVARYHGIEFYLTPDPVAGLSFCRLDDLRTAAWFLLLLLLLNL